MIEEIKEHVIVLDDSAPQLSNTDGTFSSNPAAGKTMSSPNAVHRSTLPKIEAQNPVVITNMPEAPRPIAPNFQQFSPTQVYATTQSEDAEQRSEEPSSSSSTVLTASASAPTLNPTSASTRPLLPEPKEELLASPVNVPVDSAQDASEDVSQFRYLPAAPLECPGGCGGRGTCNRDLGRCDCPPEFKGDACQTHFSHPACSHSLQAPPLTPVNATARKLLGEGGGAGARGLTLQEEISQGCPRGSGVVRRGVACQCLRQCWENGVDLHPDWWCFERSVIENSQHISTPNPMEALDLFKRAPQVRVNLRLKLESQVQGVPQSQAWDPLSLCPDRCNDRGTCENGQCVCHSNGGWRGKSCEEWYPAFCINQCSNHGECIRGFCQCHKDYYGMDCSIPVERNTSRDASATHPRVFVYELPPKFNTWLLTSCQSGIHRSAGLGQGHFQEVWSRHKAALFLTEHLLASTHRVLDPLQADYFFIPVWDACDHSGKGRKEYVTEAVDYISQRWPYWGAAPHRHILVAPTDRGACPYTEDSQLQKAVWLVHWGLQGVPWGKEGVCTAEPSTGPGACYTPGKDIVIPPWIPLEGTFSTDHLSLSPLVLRAEGKPLPSRTRQLYVDRLLNQANPDLSTEDDCPPTQGVIQRIDRDTVVSDAGSGYENHLEGYSKSVFCLSVVGPGGWAHTTTLAVLHGCIPVIVQENVTQPFEDDLPYPAFSIRIRVDEVPKLKSLLDQITEEQVQQYQQALSCVWRRFVWSSVHGDIANEDDSEDAFATFMLILKRRIESEQHSELSGISTKCELNANEVLKSDGTIWRP